MKRDAAVQDWHTMGMPMVLRTANFYVPLLFSSFHTVLLQATVRQLKISVPRFMSTFMPAQTTLLKILTYPSCVLICSKSLLLSSFWFFWRQLATIRTLVVLKRCPSELGLLEMEVALQLSFKNNIPLVRLNTPLVLCRVVPYIMSIFCFVQRKA